VLREAVLVGPGLGVGQGLEVGEREGLLAGLVSGALVAGALARAGHTDRRVRALPGPVVLVLLLALVLHSREGYHSVLAKTMPHLRAGTPGPGVVPSAAALSRARARLGEDPGRYLFKAHAADAPDLGTGALFHGMEVTAFDGTCLELAREDALIDVFGAPTGALRPQARVVTLGRCRDRRVRHQ
jgi:Insertion element 4 transposase N-terminal